ncbi:FAD-dependent oxidoreductase [Corynebacterium poyangense]|uniref:FAD-dependent oxidoreductase n=2 Tax=Corynebacterium poyangense TaxID=2684405 RepID=A0A7H0SSH4_9CORY|nr:FAD-dependent oxidoreductase [Corynebacterium poyangense]QNQ91499.1 FAD-dependent oxidoreductase [Corynebacterium poyangense]
MSTADHLPQSAEVVIIGGGVMGLSVAHYLAERGVGQDHQGNYSGIVLLERDTLGSGSSAKPLGGVRANFSDPANIILGQRSLKVYENFHRDFGVDIHLNKVGYLFLARTEEERQALDQSAESQRLLGIDARSLDPHEAQKVNPFLKAEALTGACYTPNDGHAAPAAVVEGLRRALDERGVCMCDRTEVLDIERTAQGITSVTTSRGEIRTETVVCAAGAWSKRIGEMAGVDLPVEPTRRMIGLTPQQSTPPPRIPFTLDLSTTFYFHNYGRGLLLGISHAAEPGFCREYSNEWLKEFNAAASIIAPELENPSLAGGWAGFYENTPDHNALIGASLTVPGFFYITGFSGHGFLQAPAAGELLADIITNRTPFMDPTPFSATRFSGLGSPWNELNII